MRLADQHRFGKEFPDHWDGFELRQYIADRFAQNVCKMEPSRKHRYNNDIITRSL